MPLFIPSKPELPNRHLLMVLALLSIAFALYQDIFSHSFVAYDDTRIIVDRVHCYNGITVENLLAIFRDDFPREEPLLFRDLSYLINAHLFGPLNPKGYLLGNLLLHVLAGYLVFVLATNLFPKQTGLAALAAVSFVVHPVHCEAVSWISARKDTLYTVFYLLAFLVYLNSHRSAKKTNLVVSIMLFIAALFSKSAAISFIPFLLCWRVIILRESRLTRSEIVFFSSGAIVTASYIWWYSGVLREYGVLSSAGIGVARNWASWALVTFESIFFYVTKLLYPSHLAVIYTFPAPGQVAKHPIFLALAIFSFSTFGYLLWRFHTLDKRVPLLIAWFVCALLPYFDLAQVGILVANRYAYLASIPFLIGLSWSIVTLLRRFIPPARHHSPLGVLLIALPLLLLARQTLTEVKVWRNTASLWENALQQDPDNLAAYVALMGDHIRSYLEDREHPHSFQLLDKAAEVGGLAMKRFSYGDGKYERALHLITSQLGQIAWYRGNPQRADAFFKLTFQLNHDYLKGRFIYATILSEQHRTPEALRQLDAILTPHQLPIDQKTVQAASILQSTLTHQQAN